MRVAHLVVTDSFAGVERYVCNVASESANSGMDVTVVGGCRKQMPTELGSSVRWMPGGNLALAAGSMTRIGRVDVCHVHMTSAELVGALTQPFHGGPLISTRHFAQPRGASHAGKALARSLERSLTAQVAISEYVAKNVERPPTAVLLTGIPDRCKVWRPTSRRALVLQRLEHQKDTDTALTGWKDSGLAAQGWDLRIVGDGSCRYELERRCRLESIGGVEFAGFQFDIDRELGEAGLLIAPGLREGLGVSVLEGMAAGVPVVASASGGHLETVGRRSPDQLFAAGDARGLSRLLQRMAGDVSLRLRASQLGRDTFEEMFTLGHHVDALHLLYRQVAAGMSHSTEGVGAC
jgi:glycosyltransferase involved in cell wall biosynthesis